MMTKEIVLFGTGKYFENYMLCYGSQADKRPVFAVDNDASKAGSEKCGVPVRTPEALRGMDRDSFYVIICTAYHAEIGKQLEDMGILDYQYYRPVPVDGAPQNDMGQPKPYKIGYVPGVFDLFHVGHLNLLRNSKSRCEYLIAGVLTDELVEHFKHVRPVIPYAQRAAIVSAISYVDRVVPVDFSNTRKIDAWKKYHYDCHFSGNDHGADWDEDLRQLREVGSNMEFFEYTKATSTTKIRSLQGKAEERKDAAASYRVPDKMRRTWDVELAMLDEVDRICKKYELRYFLVHGSLLGAVRHKGFIPWDDDLDIAMPRRDYDRFIQKAGEELKEPLSIHTPSTETDLFWGGFARIRNGNTTAIETRDLGHEGNLGIWIDILPFDVCTLDEQKFAAKEKRICHCQRLIQAKVYGRDFRAFGDMGRWKWRLYRMLSKCYSHGKLGGMLDAAQRMYTDEESDQVAFFTGGGKYRRLQASNFQGSKELEFEGRMVPVPAGYEQYLFEIMGRDYMKYPPEEERKPRHRGVYDPEKPYQAYVSLLCNTFADAKGKKIILFGAGLMFEDYMKKYGDKYRPAFLVDNDENKWGRARMGLEIRKPEDILKIPEQNRHLIICSFYYREISEQLDKMGIRDYKVYVQETEWILQTEERQ